MTPFSLAGYGKAAISFNKTSSSADQRGNAVHESIQQLTSQIDGLYHPRSVAIVGIPRGMKVGKLYLIALMDQEYPGDIYLVNPKADEIDGRKCFPSVSAIPGPVDLAIVLVPHHSTLPVLRECADKGAP